MNDENANRNTQEFNENDSESMKKTICSTPTRCVKMNDLDAGEIQEKIDALNLHYDQIAEESANEFTLNKETENNIFSNDVKKFIEGESSNQEIEMEEEESINLNEILLRSIKKDNRSPNRNLIEASTGKENSNTNNLILKEPDANVKIGVDVTNANTNTIGSVKVNKEVCAQIVFEEKKPSPSSAHHYYSNKISDLEVINQDHYLKPFEGRIKERFHMMNTLIKEIEKNESSLLEFSEGYKKMGFNVTEEGIIFREYAPGARSISLFGEFNNWKRNEYNLIREEFGFWSIKLPRDPETSELPIKHNTKIKLHLTLANGRCEDRNPVWCKLLYQNSDSKLYDGVFWHPESPYQFKYSQPAQPKSFKVYEAHVGMSSIEPKEASYRYFADEVLPRIKDAGYTAVQLMAIMEHAYYGSFGYHVTNFFAISSRSGNPDDLKYLIDKAHGMGLFVLLDLIHSHASSNVLDGINNFDGTDYLYFHGGERGYHKLWDSRLFNFKNWETLRLLLSNLNWFLTEYKFDGFRFDGITSMLYLNHGINYSFSGGYNEYFGGNLDMDACVYLMVANRLIRMINPNAVTIAEDVSGMPTLCRPIEEGGFGFDYRLNMSIPDKWIQVLKELTDEQWNMGNLVFTLTNRRWNEKHIGYCESHDQSIVGDKTISMWLFGREIYHNMNLRVNTIVIDRGMALHKMIRLLTFSLGGEGYLNFMGNEFGHPEWVDFPRKENGFSYHYCRRRWDLCDNPELRYKFLHAFDKGMHELESEYSWFINRHQYISLICEKDKLIAFEKGDLLFIFNFHPSKSFEHYRIGTKWASEHKILLDTDESRFGGYDRLKYGHSNFFPINKEKWNNRPNYIQLYIPSRTAMVLIAEENIKYN